MDKTATLSLEEAERLSLNVLTKNGFSQEHAEAITRSVVAAQRDECHSHGLYRLIGCVKAAQKGGIDPAATPEIHDQAPAILRINANQGCSLLAFEQGKPRLIEKAKQCGMAALAINNCFHFSALWPEVEALSAEGLAALAMTPSHAYVAPAGGSAPLLGTNPLAFSWPRPGSSPYTFDFATSVVARGEIELYRRAGKEIPEGWAVDSDGKPTTDPASALAGAMLTFGGYKGSALSTMIELLAGPLIGDLFGHQTHAANEEHEGKPFHGELVLAFSPEAFLGQDAGRHMQQAEKLFEEILGQGARLPSQRRYEARERSRIKGITVPVTLYSELTELSH